MYIAVRSDFDDSIRSMFFVYIWWL